MTADSASRGRRSTRLGGIIERRREQLGLSKREVARRIGISAGYLVALERGRNPSTGRAPVPSPRILASIARVLDFALPGLVNAAVAPMSSSAHLLLYRTGSALGSPLEAARSLFAGEVDTWVEIVDPRSTAAIAPRTSDVLIRKRAPLGGGRPRSGVFNGKRALADLSNVLARIPRSKVRPRLGIIFGARSAALRMVENPIALLESEATWEQDIAGRCEELLGVAPAANVCVYREVDIQELASRLDPLATVVALVQEHPHVAVQDAGGAVLTGPAAIETILFSARPAGVSSATWIALARAAAVGLARDAAALVG